MAGAARGPSARISRCTTFVTVRRGPRGAEPGPVPHERGVSSLSMLMGTGARTGSFWLAAKQRPLGCPRPAGNPELPCPHPQTPCPCTQSSPSEEGEAALRLLAHRSSPQRALGRSRNAIAMGLASTTLESLVLQLPVGSSSCQRDRRRTLSSLSASSSSLPSASDPLASHDALEARDAPSPDADGDSKNAAAGYRRCDVSGLGRCWSGERDRRRTLSSLSASSSSLPSASDPLISHDDALEARDEPSPDADGRSKTAA